MQVTVGECHPKKIQCMLGALQSAFREPAFLPKGGDALNMTLLIHEQEREGKKFIKKIKITKDLLHRVLEFLAARLHVPLLAVLRSLRKQATLFLLVRLRYFFQSSD